MRGRSSVGRLAMRRGGRHRGGVSGRGVRGGITRGGEWLLKCNIHLRNPAVLVQSHVRSVLVE